MNIFKTITGRADPLKPQESEDTPLAKGAVVKGRIIQVEADGQVTIRTGSRLIQAVMSEYVQPGRVVKAMVAQTSPQLVLTLAEEDQADLQPTQIRAGTAQPAGQETLRAGADILARILEPPLKGQVKIKILSLLPQAKGQTDPSNRNWPLLKEGQELSARLTNPLSGPELVKGQQVRFMASGNFSRILLQPIPAPAERSALMPLLAGFLSAPDKLAAEAANILTALADQTGLSPDIQEKVEEFSTLIKSLSPQGDGPDPEFIPRLLQRLGLVASKDDIRQEVPRLLSELARLPQFEHQKDEAVLKPLVEATVRLFEAGGQIQALNQETMINDQTFHLAFPIFWPGENGRGELTFKKPDPDNQKTDRTYKVTMLLFLTRLGRIKIDLAMENKKIDATFWTENENIRQKISRNLDRLDKSLKARGLTTLRLTALAFPRDQPPPVSLVEEILPKQGKGLIDIKV